MNERLTDVLAASVLPVLERHLERDLDGRGPGVRVEDAVEPGGGDLDEPGGELGGPGVGEPQHRRVGDAVELLADRGVDLRVPVPVNVAPEGGDAVEIAAPLDVDQLGPLRRLDHQRSSATQSRCCVKGCQR